MEKPFKIAGYCRISVDEELDRDNTSIENQKSIIKDYVERTFPDSELTFYTDRDRSGYTFEQREGYQQMRPYLMGHKYDILVVKDFSRFSRRNSRGLVELEDLRDAGVRIISIGDSIDYPTFDDWTSIQFRFLVNEMPVTDASKKVKSVIKRRQEEGRWICAVPYGYIITNSKTMAVQIEPTEAEVVRKVFELYIGGWGYKRIANYLTDQRIPTPRMNERARKEAQGEECRIKAKPEWSIITIQSMLSNDFYIGTLRQGKYTRKKINGADLKNNTEDHIVFENHHEAIVDYQTFALAKEALKKRTSSHYRGVKKYNNAYSGILVCGDCGSPMFPMSRGTQGEAYRCGKYHQRGLKGCTSHHIRADILDTAVKSYLQNVRDTSADMICKLQTRIEEESRSVKSNRDTIDVLESSLADVKAEKKTLIRQCARELMRSPEKEDSIQETYDELIAECDAKIEGIENQIELAANKQNAVIRASRLAQTAIGVFNEILDKDRLEKNDLELILDRIVVYEDHIVVKLKDDIECILKSGVLPEDKEQAANFNSDIIDILNRRIVQSSSKRKDKVYDVSVISKGDPLEIYTDREGEVIFKKYSPIGELMSFAAQYADTLNKTCGMSVVITDRDAVIACAGVPKKEYNEKKISGEIEDVIESRALYVSGADVPRVPVIEDGSSHFVNCAMPIISEGDLVGCVASVSTPENQNAQPPSRDVEIKLIQTAASFLGKQLEA